MVRCLLALSDSLLSLRRHIKAHSGVRRQWGTWPRGTPAPMSSHVCSWERFRAFEGLEKVAEGAGGLNVQGENLLLPAPSSAALKKASGKTGLQARPPPPTINHPNYKDEKDKQRKKRRGGGTGKKDRRKTQTERRKKPSRRINTFFLLPPETHFSQRQRAVSERKGVDLHFFLFSSLLVPG